MRPNLPFLSAASNALLKPGGLLGWKKRLVKDIRLLLPLTEAMKIARFTSPLLDAPRQSSPRPRLRHGRRLALLFYLGLTLNLYTLFFALSLAHLPRLPPLLTFLTVLLPRESASVYAAYLRSPFSVSYPKAWIEDCPAETDLGSEDSVSQVAMSTASSKLLARQIDLDRRRTEFRVIHARDLAKAKADAAAAAAAAEHNDEDRL